MNQIPPEAYNMYVSYQRRQYDAAYYNPQSYEPSIPPSTPRWIELQDATQPMALKDEIYQDGNAVAAELAGDSAEAQSSSPQVAYGCSDSVTIRTWLEGLPLKLEDPHTPSEWPDDVAETDPISMTWAPFLNPDNYLQYSSSAGANVSAADTLLEVQQAEQPTAWKWREFERMTLYNTFQVPSPDFDYSEFPNGASTHAAPYPGLEIEPPNNTFTNHGLPLISDCTPVFHGAPIRSPIPCKEPLPDGEMNRVPDSTMVISEEARDEEGRKQELQRVKGCLYTRDERLTRREEDGEYLGISWNA